MANQYESILPSIPAILHTSSQSRAEGLKYFEPAFGSSYKLIDGVTIIIPSNIWVNWTSDLIIPVSYKGIGVARPSKSRNPTSRWGHDRYIDLALHCLRASLRKARRVAFDLRCGVPEIGWSDNSRSRLFYDDKPSKPPLPLKEVILYHSGAPFDWSWLWTLMGEDLHHEVEFGFVPCQPLQPDDDRQKENHEQLEVAQKIVEALYTEVRNEHQSGVEKPLVTIMDMVLCSTRYKELRYNMSMEKEDLFERFDEERRDTMRYMDMKGLDFDIAIR